MHRRSDSSTLELSQARLKLADDLIFTPQACDGRVFYRIEQPSRSRFFQVGWAEYVLISLFDGQTALAEAQSLAVGVLGQEAFTEAEAFAICSWLIENDLAATEGTNRGDSHKAPAQPFSTRWNPFWMKIPLGRPDRWLEALSPWLGWLHSPPMLLLSVLFWMIAAGGIAFHWEKFAASSVGVLAPTNWLWLGAAWLGLKLVHEFHHALVCKRYGGQVPDMGVILVLFAPLAYVDVTSSWSFRSRWQRMHVAAAGMIAEFHVASVCALCWLRTDSPQVAHILFTVIFMASLTTVLFNANPLMRFDGYYLLSDGINIPNLSSNASQSLKGLLARWFLGTPGRQIGWRGGKGLFVRVYSVLAFLWRIVVCAGLIIAASVLFHGAGLVLAAFAMLHWLCRPMLRAARVWARHAGRRPELVFRLVFSIGAVAGLLHAAWNVVPWPGARQAAGIIEYAPLSIVRADVAGFVEEVFVADGQEVEQGEVLARLRNEDVETECRALEREREQSALKRRGHLEKGEIALAQVEEKKGEALEKRLAELNARRAGLLVRAPIRGRVMARELPWLRETYLEEGDPILEIGQPREKELQIAISQPDIETYRSRLQQPVRVRLRSGETVRGMLVKLDPRATETPPHPALCAPHGGPLAVNASTPQNAGDDSHRLVEPHLVGRVSLPPETALCLDAGLIGSVAIFEEQDTFGRVACRRVTRWFRDRQALFEARSGE